VEVQVRHRDDIGREHLVPARSLRGLPVEEWPVLHEQRAYKGRKSKVRQWLSAYSLKWPWQDFREAGVCHRAPVTLRHG
jgi:hypothetical protein